ncbi:MAG: hydrogenase 4 subunit F [Nitrososphaerota archaeon]|nr:hydrogenase 4 subunit F [Nitrososphaerota archaeon]MCL5671975.1 hydrogenase 4 subunit F [Nitrososphaerota archaeon]MDG6912677.1 hydrogenase 4 subunit F [Nitrososphaerota archaeon]MDG6937017.1 hydrogenase 4 subunit F [Nitrososphaerota archaeon]MDG6952164.1 hydrogenase 4 subunit F [Nitrososphaerota archaeon]
MDQSLIFVALLAAPAAGAAISLVPRDGVEVAASLASSAAAVLVSLFLLASGASGAFGLFYSDGLTRIMAITISSVFFTSVAYSWFYVRRINEPLIRFRWYYSLLDLFAFTMLLAVTVNDLGLVWIAIEATTVTSALLVALERQRTSVEAAWRYTLIVSAGLVASLLSVVFVYYSQGTLLISDLTGSSIRAGLLMPIAVGFALVGYGTKAGIAPMHAWLPDAHSEAPSPVSAMFSGILLPTSIYALVRTFNLLQGLASFGAMRNLLIGFGIFTALLAAIIMGHQRNYKRMLAYSSMENMGIILVGFALGGIGIVGAAVQIVAHAFAKSSAFYESGNILVAYESKSMAEVQGVAWRLKYSGHLFALSCLAVTGAPPFGVFVGEFMILTMALSTGNVALVLLLAAVYIYGFIGLNRQSVRMVFGQGSAGQQADGTTPGPAPRAAPQHEHWVSVAIPLANLAVALVIGVYMSPMLLQAAQGMVP